ncbi:hypothetical protein BDZ88DRAFT_487600, partial [Geranomyces variabilis]
VSSRRSFFVLAPASLLRRAIPIIIEPVRLPSSLPSSRIQVSTSHHRQVDFFVSPSSSNVFVVFVLRRRFHASQLAHETAAPGFAVRVRKIAKCCADVGSRHRQRSGRDRGPIVRPRVLPPAADRHAPKLRKAARHQDPQRPACRRPPLHQDTRPQPQTPCGERNRCAPNQAHPNGGERAARCLCLPGLSAACRRQQDFCGTGARLSPCRDRKRGKRFGFGLLRVQGRGQRSRCAGGDKPRCAAASPARPASGRVREGGAQTSDPPVGVHVRVQGRRKRRRRRHAQPPNQRV